MIWDVNWSLHDILALWHPELQFHFLLKFQSFTNFDISWVNFKDQHTWDSLETDSAASMQTNIGDIFHVFYAPKTPAIDSLILWIILLHVTQIQGCSSMDGQSIHSWAWPFMYFLKQADSDLRWCLVNFLESYFPSLCVSDQISYHMHSYNCHHPHTSPEGEDSLEDIIIEMLVNRKRGFWSLIVKHDLKGYVRK